MGQFTRHMRRALTLPALILAIAVTSGTAAGSNKYLEIPAEDVATQTLAYTYANLSNAEVEKELQRRGVPYEPAAPALGGVRLPIKLTGKLHGVWIHSSLPEQEAAKTPFDIMDGRLALALDEFCKILEAHDIVEIIHFTIYRPPTEKPQDPSAPQTRHPGGMAIDVGALKKATGHWLAVGPHWGAYIGAQTCGTKARRLMGRRGRELMSIVCEAYDQKIFHYSLTPHFDEPHSDHLHLEIKPGVKWFIAN